MTDTTEATYGGGHEMTSDSGEHRDTGAHSSDTGALDDTNDTGDTGAFDDTNDTGAHSTAAERLGGPSEAEEASATSTEEAPDEEAADEEAADEEAADAKAPDEAPDEEAADAKAPDEEVPDEKAADTKAADTNGHANVTLIDPDRAESYRGRWKELKGDFVDEPRTAVRGANELVGEVLDELEQLFRRQRDELEAGLDSDDTSTEDLRQALRKYRSFFDRLLSV
jgi:cytoskeletal protein RodZ